MQQHPSVPLFDDPKLRIVLDVKGRSFVERSGIGTFEVWIEFTEAQWNEDLHAHFPEAMASYVCPLTRRSSRTVSSRTVLHSGCIRIVVVRGRQEQCGEPAVELCLFLLFPGRPQ